ncbi:MAG TPA: bifunctional glutamate N-acetyltransferase/amino-acid acetyltransferase ArgJ, partial [Terriglobales bacterium]|nr:bifunctional glutamate N-acetyltransferase/amino-acid acetyltransferase ArgJ [Terriglobales bacterium]
MAPPRGFLFSAGAAGIKASGNPDLALALAPEGASAAAVFTRNQVVAAPVTVGRANLRASRGYINAVIVNAGNANCATGKPGLVAAKKICSEVGRHLKVPPGSVFPSSTGIIGVSLPAEKILNALPRVIQDAQASEAGLEAFANAILTTDTRLKRAQQTISFRKQTATLVGVAKGAGMIHPNMATMLVYLFTDVAAGPRELQAMLKPAVDQSFNCISIDGDTSTNDTVLLLASGASGLHVSHVRKQFAAVLGSVCSSLAAQIVADGEGVKHVVRLRVEQARTREEARRIARAIANSPLVKTAWAGADPNWGRILAAIGYSGVRVNPARVNIYLDEQQVCRNGAACEFDR